MSRAYKTIILVLIPILTGVWAAGCSAAQPPATIQAVPETPAPATEQPTAAPTASPASTHTPTATSEAAPAATEVSPTPVAESHAPVILDLVDQTIPDGERFPNVDLDEHVADVDHAVDEITWHISGNVELKTRSIGSSLIISTPGGEWTGSETLCFEACEPDGLCDAVDVVYTVVNENDAPVITIDDQVILPGEIFETIVLDEHVLDVDNPDDEITWNYSGNAELEVDSTEGVLTVGVPDEQWHGSETIRFQACDPEGACDAADVLFWVMEKSEARVEITYVGNEGFLIAVGDKKILVDALFQTFPPSPTLSPEVVELMQNARPPFDDVDLVLATHSHHDHFHAGMVWQHLQNNPQALFVSTREAVDLLPWDSEAADELRDRIIPIQLRARGRRQLAVNGIGLEIVYLLQSHHLRQILILAMLCLTRVQISPGEYPRLATLPG